MLKKCLLVAAASAVSISAFAGGMGQSPVASSHVYAGAQVGYAAHYGFHKDAKSEQPIGGADSMQKAKEQGDFAARVYGGYMFNQNFGAEVGVGTFGSQKFHLNTEIPSAQGGAHKTFNFKTRAEVGIDASLVGQVGLTDKLYVFGKAGMAIVDFNTQEIGVKSTKVNNWEWMPRAELGLGYNITPDLAVTASYAHYFNINGSKMITVNGDNVDSKSSFKKFSPQFGVAAIGLQYNF